MSNGRRFLSLAQSEVTERYSSLWPMAVINLGIDFLEKLYFAMLRK